MGSENKQKMTEGYKILESLFDENTMNEIDPFFKYEGTESGIICGFGEIKGCPAYAFAQSMDLSGGMVSKSQTAKLMRLYSRAEKSGNPIVGIFNSKGASLESGNQALEAYAKINKACCKLSGVIPQIAIVDGMCFGAMTSIVCCSDVVIVTKDSKFGVDTGGENSDVQEAGFEGMVDIIAKDENDAIKQARNLVYMMPSNNLCGNRTIDFIETENSILNTENLENKREIINGIFDEKSFVELKKEFGKHFITGFASIGGKVCGVVCSNPNDLDHADYDSCVKTAGFVMLCDSFSIPIVTLADTQKFSSAKGASKLSCAYANSTTVKIGVIIGEVYSGTSYASLCNRETQDLIFCWSGGKVSALSPQTAVEILWKDKLHGDGVDFKQRRANLVKEYMEKEINAFKICEEGLADDVISPSETADKLNISLKIFKNKRERILPKKHANINI